MKDLLDTLRPYLPDLPRDPRTILSTPRSCITKTLDNGEYVHLGLGEGLQHELRRRRRTLTSAVTIQLNIDGMRLFKGSCKSLWPILCRISKPFVSQPFTVGVFSGYKKPDPIDVYLEDCVSELSGLLAHGLTTESNHVRVVSECVVCDAPARSYVKQVVAHNGSYGCERQVFWL